MSTESAVSSMDSFQVELYNFMQAKRYIRKISFDKIIRLRW